MSGGSGISKISLKGKTGTEKQKKYAESLVGSAYDTAKANGIAGRIKMKDGPDRVVFPDDAAAVRAAYKVYSEAVKNRKTYGEVIDFAKSNDVLSLASTFERMAKNAGKSVTAYVNDSMREAKKKHRKKKK